MSWRRAFFISSAILSLLTGAVESTADTQKELLLDFTRSKQVSELVRWTGPEGLSINSDGLGYGGRGLKSNLVTIETKEPLAVGWSWYPPPSVHLTAEFQATGPKVAGRVYARYSPDCQHWSSWLALHPEKTTARKTAGFHGSLQVPRKQRERYLRLLREFTKGERDGQVDHEAVARWIIKRDPDFFSRTIPFIGYVDFRWQSSLPPDTRLNRLRVVASYHREGQGPAPNGHQDDDPWRFAMPKNRPNDGKTLSDADDGKTVKVEIGAPITVRLVGNLTTGYRWDTIAIEGNAVKQTGEPEFADAGGAPNQVGGGGVFTLPFKAVRPGESIIRLGYSRPWERGKEPAKKFTVKIQVNRVR